MRSNSAWKELLDTGGVGKFALLTFGIWLHAADLLLTATIIPTVVGEIGGMRYVNWSISLYQIGAIIFGAVAALLLRRRSLRVVLVLGAALYGAGCVLSAIAPAMSVFLAGRMAQGAGGGIMTAIGYIAIQAFFPERLWTRLMAVEATVWSVGSLLGPLAGGLFAEYGNWRVAFWAFGGQAVLLIVAACALMAPVHTTRTENSHTPWSTILVLSVATICIAQAGVTGPTAAILLVATGLALLCGAAWLDTRSPSRLLPRQAFDLTHSLGAGLMMIFVISAATNAFSIYGPLILRLAFGVSPLSSGYILATESIAWSSATMLLSGLDARHERRVIGIGVALTITGAAGFAGAVPAGSLPGIVLCAAVLGAGMGTFWPYAVRRILLAAPEDDGGLAAGATQTMQRFGFAVGAAAAGVVANLAGLTDDASGATVGRAGFWVFTAFIPLQLIAGLLARFFLAGRASVSKPLPAAP
jgi:MFS family permease